MSTDSKMIPVTEGASGIETNGINVIDEAERKGRPRDLFWPWCASNISVFGMSYAGFFLAFGVGLWQAVIGGVVGTVISFAFVGVVSLAGKRGSAPTMVLSRAAFGVRGNSLPTGVSYLLLVGWETALCSLATLATATILERLGWVTGDPAKAIGFVIVAAITIGAGIMGFAAIMRIQTWITIATSVFTVGYIALTASHVHWSTLTALPSGSMPAVIGMTVLAITGFGISWVNSGADYSRYLPRTASGRGVFGWTTFGGAIAPAVLIIYGVLLAGSDKKLAEGISSDPIGALTTLLPTWYLLPFIIVVLAGLIGGSVLDIYSSGLALLTLGLRTPRWVAAAIDGVIMVIGTIYVVWFATDFLGPFQGFLITLGVPIAAWAGIFMADVALRSRPFADRDLYDVRGRYGAWNVVSIALFVVATFVGWGLVTNASAGWLGWQGYLLGPAGFGGREGAWAYANLGVLAAIVIGFVGYLLTHRDAVMRQEAEPVDVPAHRG